jgi:acyl-CoA hydrolase
LQQALNLINTGDTIYSAINALEPVEFLEQLHTISKRASDVRLIHAGVFRPYDFIAKSDYKGKVIPRTRFSDRWTRMTHDAKVTEFIPGHLHNAATKDYKTANPDVFVGLASPPDKHGFLHFSLGATGEQDAARNARTVILEINANLPKTHGYTEIHISDVNYVYESNRPLLEIPQIEPDTADLAIGRFVASLVNDGDTIQLGIGKIPDAAARAFLNKKDLGVHTEMITTSMAQLALAGVITGKKKSLLPRKIVGNFALGTQELYDFIDDNPSVWLLPGRYTNDPYVIAQNNGMISVNSALQVDLSGQIASESIGHVQIAGTGGAADFAIGAGHSRSGKSIIAMRSTALNDSQSRIQAVLPKGAIVSISRNDSDYVVTEYGIAALRGKTLAERAEALINIAHPKFRDTIANQAEELHLW